MVNYAMKSITTIFTPLWTFWPSFGSLATISLDKIVTKLDLSGFLKGGGGGGPRSEKLEL